MLEIPPDAVADQQALAAFVVANPDLERLEAQLDQFNLFEAIGMVRQEIRHSNFLAFLLDPKQTHRLGDAFVKRFLQKAIAVSPTLAPISPIQLDIWDLDTVEVRREWQNIDILLVDAAHKLTVIIENKIDSSEHDDQLPKYYQSVHHQFPDYTVIGIYLTRQGELPSDERYIPMDYLLICQLLDYFTGSYTRTMGPDLLLAMRHYTDLLRRKIVNESDIAELCRDLYRKHQRALDLIYEYRPDQQLIIQQYVEGLIKGNSDLVLDNSSKSFIRFAMHEWDEMPIGKNTGAGWTASGRILLYEFQIGPQFLKIRLTIGPGPKPIRLKVFQVAKQHHHLFKTHTILSPTFNQILNKDVLTAKAYEGDDEAIKQDILKRWEEFTSTTMQEIAAAIKMIQWDSGEQQ